MKTFVVYKTSNLLNGRFYVGVHGTDNPSEFDGYFGSGRLLKTAIRKYRKENFKRVILVECDDEEEAYSIEKLLVKTVKEDPRSYNVHPGGKGYNNIRDYRDVLDTNTRFLMSSIGGKRCAELGKAGFQTATPEKRKENAAKAKITKEERGIKSHFSDPKVQSMLGMRGGKAHLGSRTYNDGNRDYKFFSSDTTNKENAQREFEEFLALNSQYSSGRVFRARNATSPVAGRIRYHDGSKEYLFAPTDHTDKLKSKEEFDMFISNNPLFVPGRLKKTDFGKYVDHSGSKHYNDGTKNMKFIGSSRTDKNIIESEFRAFLETNPSFRRGQIQKTPPN